MSAQQQLSPAPGPLERLAGERISLDRYYTPERLARAALAAIHAVEPIEGIVWEPHVGGGAWARAALDLTDAAVWVSDLDTGAEGLYARAYPGRQPERVMRGVDLLCCSVRASWIVGNPPYKGAETHVRQALHLTRRHVVQLLRLAFVESAGRMPFWAAHPARHVWALAQRPSFTAGGKTDSAAYGLFWWDRDWSGPTGFTPGWDWQAPSADPLTVPARTL